MMAVLDNQLQGMAVRLVEAEKRATPLSELDAAGPLGLAEAYALQDLRNHRVCAAGGSPAGWKIGLTSPAARAAFGAAEPMCGVLFSQMRLTARVDVDLSSLCAPRLEGEILLRVGGAVSHEADDAALLRSLTSVHAAFEIADSRLRDWRMGLGEAVADNACCSRFGFVEPGRAPRDLDLASVRMSIIDETDGSIVSSGAGADCMGSPLNAYRWLLKRLAARGRQLTPGQLVLTGALGPMVPMVPDRAYRVEVSGLGELRVNVTRSH